MASFTPRGRPDASDIEAEPMQLPRFAQAMARRLWWMAANSCYRGKLKSIYFCPLLDRRCSRFSRKMPSLGRFE